MLPTSHSWFSVLLKLTLNWPLRQASQCWLLWSCWLSTVLSFLHIHHAGVRDLTWALTSSSHSLPNPCLSLLLLESLCPNSLLGWGTSKMNGHLLQCLFSPHWGWHQGLRWSSNSEPSREKMNFRPNLLGNLVERGLLDANTIPFTHDSHESFLSQPQRKSWALPPRWGKWKEQALFRNHNPLSRLPLPSQSSPI